MFLTLWSIDSGTDSQPASFVHTAVWLLTLAGRRLPRKM
jgi:hypothetical protein